MRKVTHAATAITALFVALFAGTSSAQEIIQTDSYTLLKKVPAKKEAVDKSQCLAPRPRLTQGETYTLISEDFSKLTTGSEENPDTLTLLATTANPTIPSSYTAQPGWSGNDVYPAGGAIALVMPAGSYMGPFLTTPFGDYSGALKINFRAKALTSQVYLSVGIYYGKGMQSTSAKADPSAANYLLDPDSGWVDCELVTNNYSSSSEGFVQFFPYGSILLDDITITTTEDFIAPPEDLGATDFQLDGFTINWAKVTRAQQYRYKLFKQEWTSDGDVSYYEDFEDVDDDVSNLQPGWVAEQNHDTKMTDIDGWEESRALILYDEESLSTPINNAAYKDADMWVKFVNPVDETALDGYLIIDVYLKEYGWLDSGLHYYTKNLTDGQMIHPIELLKKYYSTQYYYGVRLRPSGIADSAYVVVDSVYVLTDRPYTFKEVADKGGLTTELTHTFTGLDPEGNYYYQLFSVDGDLESTDTTFYHAFGLSAPVTKEATDIDERGVFTANWEQTPKATGYDVYCYGVYKVEADTKDYSVLKEDFSKIDASVTENTNLQYPDALANYTETSLDDYTLNKGWTGVGNTIVQGALGVENNPYAILYVKSPAIYLANSDSCKIHIKAYGSTVDPIAVGLEDGSYTYVNFTQVPDSAEGFGYADTTFVMKTNNGTEHIQFATQYGSQLLLDYVEVMQDVKAGDLVPVYLANKTVGADTLSWTFSGLSDENYELFGFGVKALLTQESESTTSVLSDIRLVDLSDGIANISTESNPNAKEVARYNVSGQRINGKCNGVNIIKMSDGTTKKVLVK
ncbi:MAG: hypothetical protein ACOYJG_00650 [Prevotella sp.]|jgi:hypothetical protein